MSRISIFGSRFLRPGCRGRGSPHSSAASVSPLELARALCRSGWGAFSLDRNYLLPDLAGYNPILAPGHLETQAANSTRDYMILLVQREPPLHRPSADLRRIHIYLIQTISFRFTRLFAWGAIQDIDHNSPYLLVGGNSVRRWGPH